MSLLRSKAIRVFYSDNGALSDKTEECRTWGTPNFTFSWVAAQDALYIGKPHKFNNVYLAIATVNTNPTVLTARYWDGSAWVPFTDTVDETSGLSASGFLQWEEKAAWVKEKPSLITGIDTLTFEQELYWVKITLSADTSASTSIKAIKQLLSDDRLLTTIHPEIMNYLPTGQADWMVQHELAYDVVVNDLIMSGAISYAEQIKNVEDYLLAASYKCVKLILDPIPGDERIKEVRDRMEINYKSALRKSAASIDTNKNEVLDDPDEVEPGFVSHLER
jgi:hypothetical protein